VLRVLRGREKKKKSKHLSVFVGMREREEKKEKKYAWRSLSHVFRERKNKKKECIVQIHIAQCLCLL
jgi:ribosomal protein L20